MPSDALLITNRAVAVVLPKQPFVDWINRADPAPDPQRPVLFDEARDDPNTFLIPCGGDDVIESAEKWINRNWQTIFEQMLDDWYTDDALWPQKRSLKLFREWCEVRLHGTVFDCSDEPIQIDLGPA